MKEKSPILIDAARVSRCVTGIGDMRVSCRGGKRMTAMRFGFRK